MRIIILMISIIFFGNSGAFCAGFIGPGSQKPVYKAAAVLTAADDTPCVLEGHLLAKILGRKQRYLFEDDSGQVIVKIKNKIFGTHSVTPHNLIRLDGEVDTNDKYPNEVEVDSLEILK